MCAGEKTAKLFARKRLVFEEFFYFITGIRLLKGEREELEDGFPFRTWAKTQQLMDGLPYELTDDQKKVWKEMLAPIAVGTHALIQDKVEFAALGLVITDEQHRFGVRQRELLASKGREEGAGELPQTDASEREACGTNDKAVPHVLVMSATPIPLRSSGLHHLSDGGGERDGGCGECDGLCTETAAGIPERNRE